MLSSQTKDEVTDAAVAKLREAVGGSLSVNAIMQADESVISEAICKVGFWRRKTQYERRPTESVPFSCSLVHLGISSKLRRSCMTSLGETSRRQLTTSAPCLVLARRWLSWPYKLPGSCTCDQCVLCIPSAHRVYL